MASRITRQVRRSARLSWGVALATVLGAALLVLTPRRLETPGPVDLAAPQAASAPETLPGAVPLALTRAPVQMRLVPGPARDEPVDIRF